MSYRKKNLKERSNRYIIYTCRIIVLNLMRIREREPLYIYPRARCRCYLRSYFSNFARLNNCSRTSDARDLFFSRNMQLALNAGVNFPRRRNCLSSRIYISHLGAHSILGGGGREEKKASELLILPSTYETDLIEFLP